MKNGDMPAMAFFYQQKENGQVVEEGKAFGLTKREEFAGRAMQGLCSATNGDGTWAHDAKDVAIAAVEYADTLLAELAKDGGL